MWGQLARCTSSSATFTGAVFGGVIFANAMDAAKRAAEFLHHRIKRALERGAPSDQYVVVTGGQRRWGSKADELAQAAPHPVALHGVADLARNSKADAHGAIVVALPRLKHKTRPGGPRTTCRGSKIGAASQPLDDGRRGMALTH
jgi:hypothetical protein